jgi:hypothetical protein
VAEFFIKRIKMEEIQNKVAESGIITINLENYFSNLIVLSFDIKPYLFMEMLLKEKEFRQSLSEIEWNNFQDKATNIYCSSDAIIPMWAYMLIVSKLSGIASQIHFGSVEDMEKNMFLSNLQQLNPANYANKRVVIKGCGEKEIPPYAYIEISKILVPVVKSLMFGEPCSTVPVYKKK